MRLRKRIVATSVALPLLAGLPACGVAQEAQQGIQDAQQGVRQAQQGLQAAQACGKALQLAKFAPNWQDPAQARADAAAKAEEIGRVAERTADQTLEQHLRGLQDSVSRVASGEITPQNSAEWTQAKLDKAAKISSVCARISG